VKHHEELLNPHVEWGVPEWPYPPADDAVKTLVSYPSDHIQKGCVVYYATSGDISPLRQSIANVEYHFLKYYSYPVYIFHRNFTEQEMESVNNASQSTQLRWISTDATKNEFYLKSLYDVPDLSPYGYFLLLDPRTNILADIHFDIFGDTWKILNSLLRSTGTKQQELTNYNPKTTINCGKFRRNWWVPTGSYPQRTSSTAWNTLFSEISNFSEAGTIQTTLNNFLKMPALVTFSPWRCL